MVNSISIRFINLLGKFGTKEVSRSRYLAANGLKMSATDAKIVKLLISSIIG